MGNCPLSCLSPVRTSALWTHETLKRLAVGWSLSAYALLSTYVVKATAVSEMTLTCLSLRLPALMVGPPQVPPGASVQHSGAASSAQQV